MLDVRADVLVRGSTGLLDCMEAYLEQRCCADSTLVVLGSVQLTLSVFDSVVGSVAIAMLRRMVRGEERRRGREHGQVAGWCWAVCS